MYYPLAINLQGRIALVIGAGAVSERKVRGLLEGGARVKVVSPQATPALKRLAGRRKIKWIKRMVRFSDLSGADIIICATSDQAVNRKASLWAKQSGILVNVVDNLRLSDFISPAVLRKDKAVIAVYTDGRGPALSRDLKNFLKRHWDVFLSYRRRLSKRRN